MNRQLRHNPTGMSLMVRAIRGHWQYTVALASIGLLSGCMAGPNYVRPALPVSGGYSSGTLPSPSVTAAAPVQGGEAQRIGVAKDIQTDWWKLFRSPQLDTLIGRAFAANPTIESAQAALGMAQENVYAQRGFFFPTVQANYSPSRTKLAGNLGGNSPGQQGNGSLIASSPDAPAIYNFHTAQLTVGYTPDVFGGNARQVEALKSQENYQRFQLEAAYLTLASNIVAAAIQDASLRQQIATVEAMVAANTTAVELAGRQMKAGYTSHLELANQESALAQSKQLLPPLQKQLGQNRDLLKALAGNAQDQDLPPFDLNSLHLPEDLPLSLPSQLVGQRPDVRAAEELLHVASAQVGVAHANRLPQFSISASDGGSASHFSQMFWNSGTFFNLAGNVLQPILDGGTLLHRERAANEGLRQAAAQYKATAVTAFQNVADSLYAIQSDAESLKASTEAANAAKTAADLTKKRYTSGYLDRLALIGAEQAYLQASLNVSQMRAARLGDTAALFQSLGGGWWHRVAQ